MDALRSPKIPNCSNRCRCREKRRNSRSWLTSIRSSPTARARSCAPDSGIPKSGPTLTLSPPWPPCLPSRRISPRQTRDMETNATKSTDRCCISFSSLSHMPRRSENISHFAYGAQTLKGFVVLAQGFNRGKCDTDALRIRKRFKQLSNAFVKPRMDHIWSNCGEGDQHEGALVHSGMRKRERGRVADFISVKQEIEIDCAGRICERAY